MNSGAEASSLSRPAAVFFLACFAVSIYLLYCLFSPFFSVLVWATVLTVVFLPLFSRVILLVRGRRALAAFITCFLILILIVLPVMVIGFLVTQQSIAFYQILQQDAGPLAGVSARLHEFQDRPAVQHLLQQAQRWFGISQFDLQEYLREAVRAVSRFLVDNGPSFLKNLGGILFDFFLIFITMFFLMRDGPRLMEFVRATNPLPEAYESELIKRFQDVSYAAFFGSLLTALVQGAVACLLFLVLGLPAALFWGAVVTLMSLVPVVGALLIYFPWAAYLLLSGRTGRGIVLLALGWLAGSLTEHVLKPMIIKGRTDMHPLLVFLSVLGGLEAFGFLGILLGPLVVAVFISFLNFYRIEFRESLRQKTQTSDLTPKPQDLESEAL